MHSEVIFISNSPKGPFKPAPENPILSQRHLNADRPDKVDWAGHADLVEGPDGKYYGVFLAIRPNEQNRVNTGRETFILPVDWTGTFPVFEGGMEPLKAKLKMPAGVTNQTGQNGYFPNGNFILVLQRTEKGNSTVLASVVVKEPRPILLQVKAVGDQYTFNYSEDGTTFQPITEPVSGDILSTNVAGGFTGAMIGLYATAGNDAI